MKNRTIIKINQWVYWGMLLLFGVAFVKHLLGFYGVQSPNEVIGWGPDLTDFLFWKSFSPIFSLFIFTGFYFLQRIRGAINDSVFPILNFVFSAYLIIVGASSILAFIVVFAMVWMTFLLSARSFKDL